MIVLAVCNSRQWGGGEIKALKSSMEFPFFIQFVVSF